MDSYDRFDHLDEQQYRGFEWWEPAATFHDLGKNQKVTIRVTDTSGNQEEWFTQFTVDSCIRTFANYGDACVAGTIAVEPEPEPEIEPEGYYDGAYLMVYGLAAVNVILLILTMMSVLLSSPDRKKKKVIQMMMKRIGCVNSWVVGTPLRVHPMMFEMTWHRCLKMLRSDRMQKTHSKVRGRDRKRRKSKKTKKVEVKEVEEEVDDDDEFDEEDDDWDDDSGPKKKSERKKTVRRRSVRRK